MGWGFVGRGPLHILVEVVGQQVQQSSVSFRQLVHKSVNRSHAIFLLVVLCKTRSSSAKMIHQAPAIRLQWLASPRHSSPWYGCVKTS